MATLEDISVKLDEIRNKAEQLRDVHRRHEAPSFVKGHANGQEFKYALKPAHKTALKTEYKSLKADMKKLVDGLPIL